MPELKLTSLVLWGQGETHAEFKVGNQAAKITLTDSESAEMRAIVFAAYERNRRALADAILTAQPALLPALLAAPGAIDGEYEEVPY